MLINQQSKQEFYQELSAGNRVLIVTISPQSRATIAKHFGISLIEVWIFLACLLDESFRLNGDWFAKSAKKLTTFFKGIGAKMVLDSSFGEFALRRRKGQKV